MLIHYHVIWSFRFPNINSTVNRILNLLIYTNLLFIANIGQKQPLKGLNITNQEKLEFKTNSKKTDEGTTTYPCICQSH